MNHLKTVMVLFTKKKKLDILRMPTLFGKQIQVESEVNYLGITLDDSYLEQPFGTH